MQNLPPLARFADHLLDGELYDFLASRRNPPTQRKSYDTIAKELWAATEHTIDVTGMTVQNWIDRYGIVDEPERVAG